MIGVKRVLASLLFSVALVGGVTYGVRQQIDHLVQLQNTSSFQFSVNKPSVALQMWKRKKLPRPLRIVIATKQNATRQEIASTVIDYTFYDKGEYFEYTIWIDEERFHGYDRATQNELATSIQQSFNTMLFPESNHEYLKMDL